MSDDINIFEIDRQMQAQRLHIMAFEQENAKLKAQIEVGVAALERIKSFIKTGGPAHSGQFIAVDALAKIKELEGE